MSLAEDGTVCKLQTGHNVVSGHFDLDLHCVWIQVKVPGSRSVFLPVALDPDQKYFLVNN